MLKKENDTESMLRFECPRCGFTAKQKFETCPGCGFMIKNSEESKEEKTRHDELLKKRGAPLEARARIMWGDSPDDTRQWLLETGIDGRRSDEIIREFMDERCAEIRREGKSEIYVGVKLFFAATLIVLLRLTIFEKYFYEYTIDKIYGIAMMFFAYGLWKFLRGMNFFYRSPEIRGSVGDLTGDGVVNTWDPKKKP